MFPIYIFFKKMNFQFRQTKTFRSESIPDILLIWTWVLRTQKMEHIHNTNLYVYDN